MWKLISDNEKQNFDSIFWMDVFNEDECNKIIEYSKQLNIQSALVGKDLESLQSDTSVRKSEICFIKPEETSHWIYRKCTDAVNKINQQYFQYDLDFIEVLQFGIYDSTYEGFYEQHIDCNPITHPNGRRKLSFSIQLNDPTEYTGGDLQIYLSRIPTICEKKIGRSYFFPSHTLHEVTPVTKGIRYSLVGWVCGKPFR
jgi:PKHD-type hydroxylase